MFDIEEYEEREIVRSGTQVAVLAEGAVRGVLAAAGQHGAPVNIENLNLQVNYASGGGATVTVGCTS